MTQPGEMERPPGGGSYLRALRPDPAAPPNGVSVAWRSAAVREVARPAADKLAAAGLPGLAGGQGSGALGPGRGRRGGDQARLA